jgi:hypothetical protein
MINKYKQGSRSKISWRDLGRKIDMGKSQCHIKALKVKMARYVGKMNRIRINLPLSVRVQIYNSFVQSHLNFCSLVWSFAAKAQINSLIFALLLFA